MKPLWEVARDAYFDHPDVRTGDWKRAARAVVDAFLALPECGECGGDGTIPTHSFMTIKCPACQGRGRKVE